jgi:hypothetical protein
MQVMAALEALDRALGAGAEDPVGVQVQRALEHADRMAAVARMQRATRARRRGEQERDEQRDEEVS